MVHIFRKNKIKHEKHKVKKVIVLIKFILEQENIMKLNIISLK